MSPACLVLTCLAALVLPLRAPAQTPVPTPPPAPWGIDDVLLAETATDLQVAPDGAAAVWVKGSVDPETKERVTRLILTRFDENRETLLTRGRAGATSPRWSPDGRKIAFLSARPDPEAAGEKGEGPQIWLVDLSAGGDPYPLTRERRAVTSFAWAGNETLLFTMPELPTRSEASRRGDGDTSVMVEDEERAPPGRLFQVTLADRKVVRLTDNGDRIVSLSVAPGGDKVVAVHERSLRYSYDQQVKPAVYLYDFKRGVRERLFEDRKYNLGAVAWVPDGSGFYAVSAHTSDPNFVYATVGLLYYYDLATGATIPVNLEWDRGVAGPVLPTANGFLTLLADGAHTRAARYTRGMDREGRPLWTREWLTGEHAGNLFDLAFTPGDEKTLLYYHSAAGIPGKWYRAQLSGNLLARPVPVVALNAERNARRAFARTETIRWTGAKEEEVEGVLYYPLGYEPGKRYPLIVLLHGGPAYADPDSFVDDWYYPAHLYCQRGAFVLKPNYHGSSGYGLPFAESIRDGQYYELPVVDIERGIDRLIDLGLADRSRIGLAGWSNGAILTLALIARSTRYRAASSGAGGSEWTADWAACAFGHSFNRYYFGASPLEDPRRYRQMAPFYDFEKVRTPLILFHGTEDRSVPVHHAWMQYRALQQFGKAPVRLILFPGEGHGPQKLAHQRRKLTEELAWFDRYLFETRASAGDAVKPDSPLADLLRRRGVKRDGRGRYGASAPSGALVPETVRREAVEIGRFEVTRAQYAAFDPLYPVPPGAENLPASGIAAERARAYCEWLSQQGAGRYRLGTEAEMLPLLGEPSASENTLDWWAGYAVNPEDASRLLTELKGLGGGPAPPLIKPVGSFPGAGDEGEELLFDLHGNVAEWVLTKEGAARALGGSADLPVDTRLRAREPSPEYIGFRVVRSLAAGPPLDPPAPKPVVPEKEPASAPPPGEKPVAPKPAPPPETLRPLPAGGAKILPAPKRIARSRPARIVIPPVVVQLAAPALPPTLAFGRGTAPMAITTNGWRRPDDSGLRDPVRLPEQEPFPPPPASLLPGT